MKGIKWTKSLLNNACIIFIENTEKKYDKSYFSSETNTLKRIHQVLNQMNFFHRNKFLFSLPWIFFHVKELTLSRESHLIQSVVFSNQPSSPFSRSHLNALVTLPRVNICSVISHYPTSSKNILFSDFGELLLNSTIFQPKFVMVLAFMLWYSLYFQQVFSSHARFS